MMVVHLVVVVVVMVWVRVRVVVRVGERGGWWGAEVGRESLLALDRLQHAPELASHILHHLHPLPARARVGHVGGVVVGVRVVVVGGGRHVVVLGHGGHAHGHGHTVVAGRGHLLQGVLAQLSAELVPATGHSANTY
jgi:hypothetical protein